MSSTGCRMGRADSAIPAAPAAAAECLRLQWRSSAYLRTRRSGASRAINHRPLRQTLAYRLEQIRSRILAYRPAKILLMSVRRRAADLVISLRAGSVACLRGELPVLCSVVA